MQGCKKDDRTATPTTVSPWTSIPTQQRKKSADIIHLNCDGLKSKLNEIECLVNQYSPTILCLSESHLKEDTKDLVKLHNYKDFHYCRPGKKRKGGSSIYSKQTIDPVRNNDHDDLCQSDTFELCAIDVTVEKMTVTVINIYRVPDKNADPCNAFHSRFEELCTRLVTKNRPFIISGDFNFNILMPDYQCQIFIDSVKSLNLKFCCNQPTRKNNCLDNFIVSYDLYSEAKVINNGISDHSAILMSLGNPEPELKEKKILKKFIDWNKFECNMTTVDWHSIFSVYEVNEKYDLFLSLLSNCVSSSSLVKTVKKKQIDKKWINAEIIASCAEKKKLFRKYQQDVGNPELESEYRQYNKNHRRLLEKTKITFKRENLSKCANSSKEIWKLVNKERGKTPSKQKLKINVTNEFISQPKKITELFASHFYNIQKQIVAQQNDVQNINILPRCFDTFSPFLTSPTEVYSVICKLNNNKATGDDGISVKILKAAAPHICATLCDVFNSTLLQGIFPNSLKLAKVNAVFKKGSPIEITNYRPISILNCISKVFEKLMYSRLYSFVNKNNILNKNQYGFRKGYSTNDAVIKFLADVMEAKENNKIPIGIFYDLSKAFDSVNHSLLLKKLESYGVHGNTTKWFQSYLSKRPWYFSNENCASDIYYCNVGVPQGSVLGPLLFLLYINDLFDVKPDSVNLCAFADDTTASTSVSNSHEIVPRIVECNYSITNWTKRNDLKLNDDKTCYILFRKNDVIENNLINFSEKTKLLGVTIDSKLSFHDHINNIISKIRSSIFCLISLRSWAGKKLLIQVYHSLIESHISYCVIGWGHAPKNQIERILKIQKWALRVINRKKKRESCRELFKSDKILTFPCLYVLQCLKYARTNLHKQNFVTVSEKNEYNLRNSQNIYVEFKHTKIAQDFVNNSSKLFYNCLPNKIKSIDCDNLFLSRVKDILLLNPCYSYEEYFEMMRKITM